MGSYLSTEQPNDEEEVHNQFSPTPNNMACKPQQLQPNRLRKAPVTILSEILRVKAKLDEDLVKENNAILKEFLDTFIIEMKKDKIFQALYQKVYFTGSYYSDLRVSTPDEFDLNLVMKLPFKLNIVNGSKRRRKKRFYKGKVIKNKPDMIHLEEVIEPHEEQCPKKKRHSNQITKTCRKRKGLKKKGCVQKEVFSATELEKHEKEYIHRNEYSHSKNPSSIPCSAKVKSCKFPKCTVKRKRQNKKSSVDLKDREIETTKNYHLYDGQNIDVYRKSCDNDVDTNNQCVKNIICEKKRKCKNLHSETKYTNIVSSVDNSSNFFKNNKKRYKYNRNYWVFLKSIKRQQTKLLEKLLDYFRQGLDTICDLESNQILNAEEIKLKMTVISNSLRHCQRQFKNIGPEWKLLKEIKKELINISEICLVNSNDLQSYNFEIVSLKYGKILASLRSANKATQAQHSENLNHPKNRNEIKMLHVENCDIEDTFYFNHSTLTLIRPASKNCIAVLSSKERMCKRFNVSSQTKYDVEYQPQVPSFAKYSVADQNAIKEKGLEKLFEDGYLKPDKVRTWLQSVVDKARLTYKPPRGVVQVKCSSSGPAKTIKLVKRDGIIDIDLVPVIECSLGLKPPGIDGRVYAKVQNKLQCFLVPKPYQTPRQAPVNEKERSRLWRAHYPDAESSVLYNLGCVKPVIKLLKLLRDKENWDILASYYLKTIVLWMVLLQPSADYWKQDRIGERFIEALHTLADNVKERKIRYFFSSRYNLLEKLSAVHSENIYHRLCSILKQIERDNDNLWGIFGCSPTFHM